MKLTHVAWFLTLLLVGAILVGCGATPAPAATSVPAATSAPAATATPTTYTDPFAYCAAVGTVDTPGSNYVGPQVPESVARGLQQALNAPDTPIDVLENGSFWRCMDGSVYACFVGANLPCEAKANTDRTPTQEETDYCQQNPNSDFIPAVVTGRETVYEWRCLGGTPDIVKQLSQPDVQGFLSDIWYKISPNAATGAATGPTPLPPTGLPTASTVEQIVFDSNRGGDYQNIYVMDADGGNVVRLTTEETNDFAGPWSPDGQRVAFTRFGLTTSGVWVMNADGSGQIELTSTTQVDEGFPAWSPDGQRLAYTTRRDGNNEIYVMNADGSTPVRLTNNPADDFAPSWSPDGSRIAFVSDRDNPPGVYDIYVMNADGSAVTRLTTNAGSTYTPAWSPDGTRIAFRLDRGGSSDVYVINIDGTGLQDLTNDPANDWAPSWSPDGSQIAFQTNRDGNWEIYVMNADGTAPTNLTQNPADDQLPFWGR
jgi:dipeptidyl aminopeptidase/acylaminoacyl peptidase